MIVIPGLLMDCLIMPKRFHALFLSAGLAISMLLAGCVYQPLHGSASFGGGDDLAQIWVEEVDDRIAQQVRNHLIFLLQGGNDNAQTRYRLKIRVISRTRQFAAVRGLRDRTAGAVNVIVSYSLFDNEAGRVVASGRRDFSSAFDRTGQNFANNRAERDAANRAAREVAEQLRLALAAHLRA